MIAKHKPMTKAVKKVVEKEFADFFETFCDGTDKWPGLTDQQLCDGVSDALVEMARRRKLADTALLQTLVCELQDRVNLKLNK